MFYDRVEFLTPTTGTGDIVVGAAVSGGRTFADAGAADGDAVRYVAVDGAAWEIGRGIMAGGATEIVRDAILDSTDGGTAINLSGNAKMFGTVSAKDVAGIEARALAATAATLSALGQVAREQPALRAALDQGLADIAQTEADIAQTEADILADLVATGGPGQAALSAAGQLARQVNGGRVALAGGTLADPALQIGTVGVYSSAADTLSIAIAGTEVARFTSSGLTVFGVVTEA